MNDDLDTLNITINTTGNAGDSGAVGTTYSGYIPGYGPVPAVAGINNGPVGIYNPPGQITVASNPSYTGIGTPTYQPNIHIKGPNPFLATDKDKIDLNELAEMMKIMRERLLILVPDFEKHEKYEALKKAYDHYKLIEAMIAGKEDGK